MREVPAIELRENDFDIIKAVQLMPGADPQGRVSIYERPQPNATYVGGADFSLGLKTGDKQTAAIYNIACSPVRQVAELCGVWDERYWRVLYCLVWWYDAFLVGEQQFGLHALQNIWRAGHRWLYYRRHEHKQPSRPVTDELGYAKHGRRARDPNLNALRVAVRDRALIIRSRETIDQMTRLEYTAPETKDRDTITDEDLDIRLSGGGSPDLVMCHVYAWLAAGEVVHYDKPEKKIIPGSLGDILGHEVLYRDDAEHGDQDGPTRRLWLPG